ncbi:MAG TPA: ABC transporter ATP-binding protein [Candidatus Thermoplasmatota archaeon]|nr:ABC transporter ATP-binding protein [Candidatus Thermoplasmatota archaeon]
MLRFEEVSRRYGSTLALDGVSFALELGSFAAVVGENGAGKSTLLRLAATLERPSAGRVALADGPRDAREGDADERASRRARIGWLGQEPGLYDELTVRENLLFAARLFGREREVEAVAARLGAKLDERARRLSRGEKQRAALARALLCGDVLLLDEPTSALDAEGAQACGELLGALRGERTMLVATHDPELVKRADRVLRLHGGRLA